MASHHSRLQRLRHGSAHGPGSLVERVDVCRCGSFLVTSDTGWRPSNAGNRTAVVPIHSNELLRVGEVLIRNLQ